MSQRFSVQFKQEAVQLVSTECPVAEVASQQRIGYSTLDKWVRCHHRCTGQLAELTRTTRNTSTAAFRLRHLSRCIWAKMNRS